MRNYVLIVIFNIVCMQQLKSAVVVVPQLTQEQKLRERLLALTPLPYVVCDMIIAYMRAYVIAFNLAHESSVLATSFSPDGKWIATAGYKGMVYLWDEITQKAKSFRDHEYPIASVSFSPNTRLLATAGYDHIARIWCTGTGSRLFMLQGHSGALNAVSFSPDGGHLVTASDDRTMRLWDVETATSVLSLNRHAKWVCSAAFDTSGNKLVSASNDKTVRIWDIRSGLAVQNLFGHTNYVNSASFSSNGERIITASDDATVRMWNRNAKVMGILPIGSKVRSAKFNFDERYILTAGDGKIAGIWDSTTQKIVQHLDTDAEPVYAASFGPLDDGKIVTASKKRVLVWSLFYNAYTSKKLTLS